LLDADKKLIFVYSAICLLRLHTVALYNNLKKI